MRAIGGKITVSMLFFLFFQGWIFEFERFYYKCRCFNGAKNSTFYGNFLFFSDLG